jgi:hypothetical protein
LGLKSVMGATISLVSPPGLYREQGVQHEDR